MLHLNLYTEDEDLDYTLFDRVSLDEYLARVAGDDL
jgi:hypothetical protein